MNALRMRMFSLWPAFRRLKGVKKLFRIFARAESGAAAFYFALSSPVWLGGLALGAEVGSWYYFEQKLQATADAVAVSIAGRVGTGASQAELDSLANDFLTRNQFKSSLGSATVTLSSPPGPVFVNGNTVNVELTRTVRPFLTGIFRPGEFVIRVTAAAQVNQATEGCVLASGIQAGGLDVGSANIQVNGCEVLSNGNVLRIAATGRLTTDCARAARGLIMNGPLTVACRNGQPDGAAGFTLDPYVDTLDPNPSIVSCATNTSVTIGNNGDWSTLNPGTANGRAYVRFCSGASLDIFSAGTITIPPGWNFLFEGGKLNVYNTHLIGVNVSFYFFGGGLVNIFGPTYRINFTTDDPNGMLFRGARTNNAGGNPNTLFIGPGSNLQGAIYFPASTVQFQASGTLNGCPQIIANAVQLGGTWRLDGPCRAPGIRPIVASRDVDLTQ